MLVVIIGSFDKLSDVNLLEMYQELTSKMKASGIWEQELIHDPTKSKRFSHDLDLFVQ